MRSRGTDSPPCVSQDVFDGSSEASALFNLVPICLHRLNTLKLCICNFMESTKSYFQI